METKSSSPRGRGRGRGRGTPVPSPGSSSSGGGSGSSRKKNTGTTTATTSVNNDEIVLGKDPDIKYANIVHWTNHDVDAKLKQTDFMYRLFRHPESIMKRLNDIASNREINDPSLNKESLEKEVQFLRVLLPTIYMGMPSHHQDSNATAAYGQYYGSQQQIDPKSLMNDIASFTAPGSSPLHFQMMIFFALAREDSLWKYFGPLINPKRVEYLKKMLKDHLATENSSILNQINYISKFSDVCDFVVSLHYYYQTGQRSS